MLHKNIEVVLNGLDVAVFVVDADHRILFRNDASTGLFGTGIKGQILGSFVPDNKCLSAVDAVLEGVPRKTVELQLQLAVPTQFKVNIVRLEIGPQDKNLQAVVTFEDTTHKKEAEQMRSDFVANVSHELRSPLTALYGFIETLQGPARDDAEASDRFLGLMEQEAKRMTRLIDDLLSLSKLQSKERIAPTEKVNISKIIKSVVASLEPTVQRENAKIILKVKNELPKVFGEADALTQVFHNLIENALKYGRVGGKVTVTVKKSRDKIKIAVTDDGDGIKDEHLQRLTERFYRIDKGRSRDKGGTGLGLAIVKHILMRHRGQLQIASELGVGSSFIVYLPHVG